MTMTSHLGPSAPSSSPPPVSLPLPGYKSRVPYTSADRQALMAAVMANKQLKPPKPIQQVCRDFALTHPHHSANGWYNFYNKHLILELERGTAIAKAFPKSAAAAALSALPMHNTSSPSPSPSPPQVTHRAMPASFKSNPAPPSAAGSSLPRPRAHPTSLTPPAPRPIPLAAPRPPRRVSFADLPRRSPSASPDPPMNHARGPSPTVLDAMPASPAPAGRLAAGAWDPDASFPAIHQRSPAPLSTLRRRAPPPVVDDPAPAAASSPRKRPRHGCEDEDHDDDHGGAGHNKRSKPSAWTSNARSIYNGPVVRKAIRSAGPLLPTHDVHDADTQATNDFLLSRPLRLSGTMRVDASPSGSQDEQIAPADEAATLPYHPLRFSGTTRMSDVARRVRSTPAGEDTLLDPHGASPRANDDDDDTLPSHPLRFSGTTRSAAPTTTLVHLRAATLAPPTPGASSSSSSSPPASSSSTPRPPAPSDLPDIPWATDPESTHIDIHTWVQTLARDTRNAPDQVLRMLHSVNFNRTRCARIAHSDPRVRQDQVLEWVWTPQEDNLLLIKPEEEFPDDPRAQRKVWQQKKALIALKGGQRAAWERLAVLMGGKAKAK